MCVCPRHIPETHIGTFQIYISGHNEVVFDFIKCSHRIITNVQTMISSNHSSNELYIWAWWKVLPLFHCWSSLLLNSCFTLAFTLWLYNTIHYHRQNITESLAVQFHSLRVQEKCHLQATDSDIAGTITQCVKAITSSLVQNVPALGCKMGNINIHYLLIMSRQWQWLLSPTHTYTHSRWASGSTEHHKQFTRH